jgi:hypothetical protein
LEGRERAWQRSIYVERLRKELAAQRILEEQSDGTFDFSVGSQLVVSGTNVIHDGEKKANGTERNEGEQLRFERSQSVNRTSACISRSERKGFVRQTTGKNVQ